MATHNRRDGLLTVTKALPAAAATAYTDSFDIGHATLGAVGDIIEIEASLPALPSLADTKTCTVTFQDSADNSTFAAITGLSTFVVTGVATGQGSAAATRQVRLPSGTRRYVRASAAVESSGGDNTAKSLTLSLLT